MRKKIELPYQKVDHRIGFKQVANRSRLRIYFLGIFMIVILFIQLFRLFHLTIIKNEYYKLISENNRIKEIIITPKRGTIMDRNNKPIVFSTVKDNTEGRSYVLSEAGAHFFGYRQIADKNDIAMDSCPEKIQINDKIGKAGLEKVFECLLRGKKGKKLVETNANGNIVKELSKLDPINGKSIISSIDLEIQKKAYELIKDKKAAVVATKPQTGEVLVLTSSPSFNPEIFEKNDSNLISDAITDQNKPLFFRATKGLYPPGSVFKIAVAAGALETKVVDENFSVNDTGRITAGPITFGNWYFLQYGKTEGEVNLVKSLQRSNDIYYYRIGEKLGDKEIKKWAEIFGYGTSTGIATGDEAGNLPYSFWKEEVMHEQWYLGDTYNYSIGQGYVTVSPLQVNLATLPYANNGYYCKPKTLKIVDQDIENKQLEKETTPECHKLPISQKTIDLVREGMRQACSTGGTGWPFFDYKIPVGCKTGSAENSSANNKSHAWFTIFAPFDKPEIVLTVMVEDAGEGSEIAAPIAKEIINQYLLNN
jgi:penicillin-binding protein 2